MTPLEERNSKLAERMIKNLNRRNMLEAQQHLSMRSVSTSRHLVGLTEHATTAIRLKVFAAMSTF